MAPSKSEDGAAQEQQRPKRPRESNASAPPNASAEKKPKTSHEPECGQLNAASEGNSPPLPKDSAPAAASSHEQEATHEATPDERSDDGADGEPSTPQATPSASRPDDDRTNAASDASASTRTAGDILRLVTDSSEVPEQPYTILTSEVLGKYSDARLRFFKQGDASDRKTKDWFDWEEWQVHKDDESWRMMDNPQVLQDFISTGIRLPYTEYKSQVFIQITPKSQLARGDIIFGKPPRDPKAHLFDLEIVAALLHMWGGQGLQQNKLAHTVHLHMGLYEADLPSGFTCTRARHGPHPPARVYNGGGFHSNTTINMAQYDVFIIDPNELKGWLYAATTVPSATEFIDMFQEKMKEHNIPFDVQLAAQKASEADVLGWMRPMSAERIRMEKPPQMDTPIDQHVGHDIFDNAEYDLKKRKLALELERQFVRSSSTQPSSPATSAASSPTDHSHASTPVTTPGSIDNGESVAKGETGITGIFKQVLEASVVNETKEKEALAKAETVYMTPGDEEGASREASNQSPSAALISSVSGPGSSSSASPPAPQLAAPHAATVPQLAPATPYMPLPAAQNASAPQPAVNTQGSSAPKTVSASQNTTSADNKTSVGNTTSAGNTSSIQNTALSQSAPTTQPPNNTLQRRPSARERLRADNAIWRKYGQRPEEARPSPPREEESAVTTPRPAVPQASSLPRNSGTSTPRGSYYRSAPRFSGRASGRR